MNAIEARKIVDSIRKEKEEKEKEKTGVLNPLRALPSVLEQITTLATNGDSSLYCGSSPWFTYELFKELEKMGYKVRYDNLVTIEW